MKKIKIHSISDYRNKRRKGEISCAVQGTPKNSQSDFALDLRGYHGKKFSGTIRGTECSGVIVIENNRVYLCQNEMEGSECINKMGYSCSWVVQGESVSADRDVIINKIGTEKWKIAFKTPQKSFS
jgi:hypothetical protein